VRRARVERTDRHDRRLDRIDDAADDLLHRDDERARDEDRVDGEVRRGAVTAFAVNRDLDRVAGRVHWPLAETDDARCVQRREMQAVRALDAVLAQNSGFDHRARATQTFFGGLKAEHDGAGNLGAALRQNFCGTEQHRDVTVVAARVHLAVVLRAVVGLIELENGQRVHVGAQHDRLPRLSALENAEHAGLRDAFVHLDAERAQTFGDDAGRAVFLEAQFRMRVQVAPGRDDFLEQRVRKLDRRRHVRRLRRTNGRPGDAPRPRSARSIRRFAATRRAAQAPLGGGASVRAARDSRRSCEPR
jgi:hypothetical protein